MPSIALLTDSQRLTATDDIGLGSAADDAQLGACLKARGLDSQRVAWDAPNDWSQFATGVFRTTWNYIEQPLAFRQWLDAMDSTLTLHNSTATVRWNMDKHYLADLVTSAVPVVPTHFVEAGSSSTLAEAMMATGWSQAVLKPVVSASGKDTYRVSRDHLGELTETFSRLIADRAMMLQPFRRSILTAGEASLVFIAGRYSHAVRKTAQAGEFKVQQEFGGTSQPHRASKAELAAATAAIAACPETPTYARVDLIESDAGEPELIELELIEPELWLRDHPSAADALAEAIVATL